MRRREHATAGARRVVPGSARRHDGAVAAAEHRCRRHRAAGPTVAPWYRRLDRKLLAASLAIAVGLVLIGVRRSPARSPATRPPTCPARSRTITPVPDAVQVLQQTQVVVDLAEGYEGRLIDRRRRPADDPPRRARRRSTSSPASRSRCRRAPCSSRATHAHVHARRGRADRRVRRRAATPSRSSTGRRSRARRTARSYTWTFDASDLPVECVPSEYVMRASRHEYREQTLGSALAGLEQAARRRPRRGSGRRAARPWSPCSRRGCRRRRGRTSWR